MLEGITILSQTEIFTINEKFKIPTIIALIVAVLSVIIAHIVSCYFGKTTTYICVVISFIFITIFSSCGFALFSKTPTGKYEYQVTIADNVSMNDFYEKYEVIKVEGEIYTIKEK